MGIQTFISQEKMLNSLFEEEFDFLFDKENGAERIENMVYEEGQPPVDIYTFVTSKDYLGLQSKIYPAILYSLRNIEDFQVREADLMFGKGSGKSTILQIFLTYMVYRVLKLKNPQEYFELLPGSVITVLNVSVSEKQAKEVVFNGVKSMVENCPWFRGKYNAFSLEIRFIKDVVFYCGNSGTTSWLGFNTVAAAMDEVEYLQDNSNRSVAQQLYRALKGSLTTRFPGKFKLLCVSSPKDEYSFLNTRFKLIRDNGEKLVVPDDCDVSDHEANKRVSLRTSLLDKLLTLRLQAYKYVDPETSQGVFAMKGPTWCVNPKTSLAGFKDDFISDEAGAMRDYAAEPQHAQENFFKAPEILDLHAVHAEALPIDRETLIIADWFEPKIGFNYFFAGDLSVSGDNTGLSMAHFDWTCNKVELDFCFEKHAEKGVRIDYEPIRQLIYNLVDRGFNIKKVLFDQFQSNDSINQVIQHGIPAEQVNYAESFVGCTQLHELIHTERLVYYDTFVEFIGEAKELQIVNSKRIDHLKSGGYYNGKDAWDSAVNACLGSIDDYYKNGSVARNNQTVSNIADRLLLKDPQAKLYDKDDISWLF